MKRIKLNDLYNQPFLSEIQESEKYVLIPFYRDGKPFGFSGENAPLWGMTLRNAGSMRFRWNEKNENREKLLSKIAGGRINQEKAAKTESGHTRSQKLPSEQHCKISQVQLDHTKIVVFAEDENSTREMIADGIVTCNKNLMPVVTIADCVALYLFDCKTGGFGIVHSGWKGTGIVVNAINLMKEKFGSEPENILTGISACIHDCCYIVTEDRAEYFRKNFGEDCIKPLENKTEEEMKAIRSWNGLTGPLFRLSLVEANLQLLKNAGIQEGNIAVLDECTSCNSAFGSNRRETSEGSTFTVQAAFVRF